MCRQTIVTDNGDVISGELRDHLGAGRVGIDVDGKRYVGRKVDDNVLAQAWTAKLAQAAARVGAGRVR